MLFANQQIVKVTLLENDEFSKIFQYIPQTNTLMLKQTFEVAMTQGNICPKPGYRDLTFSLDSNVLGKS